MMIGHEIALRLRAAYWSMHRNARACLAASGVTADQFVILSLLAEEDGITQQELVRRASSDPNTVRPMLVLLERRRLVARRPHPRDGRAYSITLTDRGRRTYGDLLTEIRPLQDRLSSVFRCAEGRLLIDFLMRIEEAAKSDDRRGQVADSSQSTATAKA